MRACFRKQLERRQERKDKQERMVRRLVERLNRKGWVATLWRVQPAAWGRGRRWRLAR